MALLFWPRFRCVNEACKALQMAKTPCFYALLCPLDTLDSGNMLSNP